MSATGGVEVRGVIAMNGRGELCFFADSWAEGLPLLDRDGVNLIAPSQLREAILAAPARRVTHAQLELLDPRECPRCHGDGEIPVAGYSVSPYSGVSVLDPQEETVATCPDCHGKGWL